MDQAKSVSVKDSYHCCQISSCVVFDEGHLLEFVAQKALTYKVGEQTLASVLELLNSQSGS